MLTNLGFECVVRGLRIGKHMRRSLWEDESYVYLDHEAIMYHDGVDDDYERPFLSEDILAKDWVIRA